MGPATASTLVAVLAIACPLAGCASNDQPVTPAACLAGPDAYLRALDADPTGATLAGGVPIGDCLIADQEPGELSRVGAAMVAAATVLNSRATRADGGAAAVALGYLDGTVAVADADTGGVHTDLARRVDSAARYVKRSGSVGGGFKTDFERGYEAARSGG